MRPPRMLACALLVLLTGFAASASATATLTTYTDRAAWRTAVGSSTGNAIDDLGSGTQSRGAYAISGAGVRAVFPNYNPNSSVDGTTAFLRCDPEGSTPAKSVVFTFASNTTAVVFDVNPSSYNLGAGVRVTLNGGAGSTSFTLAASDVTTTWGLVSTNPFTTMTLNVLSGTGSITFGIDDVEIPAAAPAVTGVSLAGSNPPVAASGSSDGGTAVTITGTGFRVVGGAASVTVGGVAATGVTVNGWTSISATTPAGTVGTASVVVTTAGGSNAANSLFTYLSPALTPTFGTPTRTVDGFTVQVANHDAVYTWGATATAGGTATISNTGLVTVTGLSANTSSTVTVTTTRSGYVGGDADVTGSALDAQPNPPVSSPAPGSIAPGEPAGPTGTPALLTAAPPGGSAPIWPPRAPTHLALTVPDVSGPAGPVARVTAPGRGVMRTVGRQVGGAGASEDSARPGAVVCSGVRRVASKGSVLVECHLNRRGRAALERHSLRMSMVVTYAGPRGIRGVGAHVVTLRRLPERRAAVTG